MTHKLKMLYNKERLFITLLITLIGLSFTSRKISAKPLPLESSDAAVVLNQIDASALSLQEPTINVSIEVRDKSQESINLELAYVHFDSGQQPDYWADNGHFSSDSFPIIIGTYTISIAKRTGIQASSISLPKNIIAHLKKHPALIVGKIVTEEDNLANSVSVTPYIDQELTLFHVSALAFDNPMYSSGNMAPQIRETVEGIKVASDLKENVFSVVLADGYGDDNSKIYFVFGNSIIAADTLFSGLPNTAGEISRDVTEYDMGDGETLGGFLKWVNSLSKNGRTSFSYYGHGSAIMPNIQAEGVDTEPAAETTQGSGPITMPSWVAVQPSWVAVQPSWVAVQPSWVAVQPSWVAVQPSWVAVQPSWSIAEEHFATDSHPLSLISVKDISRALQLGSNNGENRFAVLDLVHCFSLSIEQVYELAPYAESIVGSANYHFFDARMPGNALADINPNASSLELADEIMRSYDDTLPSSGYPRTMAVIDGSQVKEIKTHWDQTSAELLRAFEKDHAATRSKLQQAYRNSTKYDSTSCDNEFSLKSPDALVDFYQFATQIEAQFSDNPMVKDAAHQTSAQIDSAIYSMVNGSGNPWFGTSETDHWNFTGKGLSIFADLQGIQDPNSQSVALSWQTAFYNRLPNELHAAPFEFLMSEGDQESWADVIEASWLGYDVYPQSCLITIPPDQDEVDVSIVDARIKTIPGGERVIAAEIITQGSLGNLMILFEIMDQDEIIFSELVYSGWREAGEHTIMTENTLSSDMRKLAERQQLDLRITLDPFNYLIETSKDDNELIQKISN